MRHVGKQNLARLPDPLLRQQAITAAAVLRRCHERLEVGSTCPRCWLERGHCICERLHALEPLVYDGPADGKPEAEWELRSPKQILSLRVCDMAVGSAAFLVQACRYLADKLVESWALLEEQHQGKVLVSPEGKLVSTNEAERPLPRSDEEFLPEEVKMREWSVARLGYLLNSEDRVAFALDPHFDGAADDGRVHEVFLGLENRTNWGAMIDLVRDENGERADDLGRIAAPALLVFGELDQAYSPTTFGAEFERRIPDARLEVIEGAGHYPHEQEPATVARLLLEFHRGSATPPASR